VTLYGADDLRKLLELVENQLEPTRWQRFEALVLARGPIPDELLEKIRNSHQLNDMSCAEIAARLNERGIIAGMGGHYWTDAKVTKALVQAADKVGAGR
jgi:hypothetical protein